MPNLIKDGRIVKTFGYDDRGRALCQQAARAQGGVCQMENNSPEQKPNPNLAGNNPTIAGNNPNDGRYPKRNMGPRLRRA